MYQIRENYESKCIANGFQTVEEAYNAILQYFWDNDYTGLVKIDFAKRIVKIGYTEVYVEMTNV